MEHKILSKVLELEGREVDEFLKYDQRELTVAEEKSLQEADAFYNIQCSA